MSEMIIIVTPDDKVKHVPFEDYKSVCKAVGGFIERCAYVPMTLGIQGNSNVTVYCNEEFLLTDDADCDKVNAVATMLNGYTPIYGNAAFCIDTLNEDNELTIRGFKYKEYADEGCEPEMDICECWFAEDILMQFIKQYKNEISKIHKQYDGEKPEPEITFVSFDELEKE